MAYVSKKIVLIHRVSGSLLRCVYCTCSYRDDEENSIYWAALLRGGLQRLWLVCLTSHFPASPSVFIAAMQITGIVTYSFSREQTTLIDWLLFTG